MLIMETLYLIIHCSLNSHFRVVQVVIRQLVEVGRLDGQDDLLLLTHYRQCPTQVIARRTGAQQVVFQVVHLVFTLQYEVLRQSCTHRHVDATAHTDTVGSQL